MFGWLTRAVARASRRHPMLLAMLADGRLHVSGIERLAPHLTEENRAALLKRAVHKTRREIEELVAEVAPRPEGKTTLRKLPELRPGTVRPRDGVVVGAGGQGSELRPDGAAASDGTLAGPGELRPDGVESPGPLTAIGVESDPRPVPEPGSADELRPNGVGRLGSSVSRPTRAPEPIGPKRFRLQFDLDAEFKDELERLQALMRSSVPDGDLGQVIRLAVSSELERLEARRFAKTKTPRQRLGEADTRAHSRHIPAAVRRFVARRDGDRCTYRDKQGRRCSQRHDLEFHHVVPFGLGGDHRPETVALMCRTHNQLLAEDDFGKERMARHRRQARRDTKEVTVVGAGKGGERLRGRWRPKG